MGGAILFYIFNLELEIFINSVGFELIYLLLFIYFIIFNGIIFSLTYYKKKDKFLFQLLYYSLKFAFLRVVKHI